ncbi:MFS transporter [Chloroflexota bacterium]
MANGITNLISKLGKIQTFKVFSHGNFVLLFLTTITVSVGNFMMMVALGWLVLELTDSPLSLGVVWATRSAPHMVFGVLAGTFADRFNRRLLLIVTFILLAISSFIIGILITLELIQLWHVLVLTFVMGSLMTFDGATRQAFVVDIVGRDDAMSAISVNAVGMRIIGIFGGAAAGFVIEWWGTDWCFYIKLVTYIVAIVLLLFIRGVEKIGESKKQSIRGSFVDGFKILGQNQVILALMVMTAACEIFGFSYGVLTPVFARDVLDVGAIGLGMFSTAASAGGLIALVVLASLGNYKHKGRLMLGVFLAFGISLILFSQSPWYPLSLVLLGLVGAMAASHDALQHTLMQLNVTDEQRGRAMGIWQMGIGFGPVGMLTLGWLADMFGAQLALSSFGLAMVVIFAMLLVFTPRLRNV